MSLFPLPIALRDGERGSGMDRAGEMGYDARQPISPHFGREPNQAGVARFGQHEPCSSGILAAAPLQ